jgi:hypothetical protein
VVDGFWLRRYILYKLLPRATAKKLNEKASLYEGHGFSRAVNRLCLTASAAEVRFCVTHDQQAHSGHTYFVLIGDHVFFPPSFGINTTVVPWSSPLLIAV